MRVRTIIVIMALMISSAQGLAADLTIEQMRQDLVNVDKGIVATRKKIHSLRDTKFLPELYFALAELLVQKSRYQYSLREPDKKIKLEAIEAYDKIIDRFASYIDHDKALFLKAHELRELGQTQDMVQTYERLVREHPDSRFVGESLLNMGDYWFEEKKDFGKSLGVYKTLLERENEILTALANYKIGWVYINLNQFTEALLSFEKALQSPTLLSEQMPEAYRKTDIRREALLALVWPYSELMAKDLVRLGEGREKVLAYFRKSSPELFSYQKVLRKLATRLELKHRFADALEVQVEVLQKTSNLSDQLAVLEKIYGNLKQLRALKQSPQPPQIVEALARIVLALSESQQLSAKEKKKVWQNLELITRDLSTQQNQKARQSGSAADWQQTIAGYELYLSLFPNSKYRQALRLNLAESYFHAGQFVEGAREYERLGHLQSAIESYALALRNQTDLSRLLLVEARYGLRDTGGQLLAQKPNTKEAEELRFNIAQSYYDERLFDRSTALFKDYIRRYPQGRHIKNAVHLLLDSHHQKDDFTNLIADGVAVMKNKAIRDQQLHQQVYQIVQQAELRSVQAANLESHSPDYAEHMLRLARKYKGSELGDKALYSLFTSLKDKNDFKAYEMGEQLLLQHRNSEYALQAVSALGDMALKSADFKRAALYFELFAERYPKDSTATALLANAAQLRESLGEYKVAAQNYRRLNNPEAVARMDFLAQDWPALLQSAPNAGSINKNYWLGLAHYRLHGIRMARPYFIKLQLEKALLAEQKDMQAHALYLLTTAELEQYRLIKMRPGQEQKTVGLKATFLKKIEQQLNHVAKLGSGRWALASLYSLGQSYQEFAAFIASAPLPVGLSAPQVQQYRQIIKGQSDQYAGFANKYFTQCQIEAERYLILSSFVQGCQSKGRVKVDEAKELANFNKTSLPDDKKLVPLRRELLTQTKNIKNFTRLAEAHLESKDYTLAEMVISRAMEFAPQNDKLMALMGLSHYLKTDWVKAKNWFEKARQKNGNNSVALWGLANVYQKFNFTRRYREMTLQAKKVGRPQGAARALDLSP